MKFDAQGLVKGNLVKRGIITTDEHCMGSVNAD
jgi:hypothetical protein